MTIYYIYYTSPEGVRPNFVYSKTPMNDDILKFLNYYGSKARMLSLELDSDLTREQMEVKLKENILNFIPPVLQSDIIDLYIDMDDTIFKFTEALEKRKEETGINYPQAEYGFFANLKPFDKAIETVKKLIESPKYNVRFATAPSVYNPMSYTEKRICIFNYFGIEAVEKLIMIKEKELLDRSKMGIRSILIDDKKEGYGQELFGEQVVYGSSDCPNWEAVNNMFLKSDYF